MRNPAPSWLLLTRITGSKLRCLILAGILISGLGNTLGGLGVIIPYPFMAYRGWIGGIVSIDGAHVSRLKDLKEAVYYLVTLVLQLIPSILAGGIGVNLGLSYYRPKPHYQGDKWLVLSKESIRDVIRIYLVAIPLFMIASLWEFGVR